MKRCKNCGGTYPDVFFRDNRTVLGNHGRLKYRKTICIGCELTARTKAKFENRPKVKAEKTRKLHAAKFVRQGIIGAVEELRIKYGWNTKQMAHDIEHASKNGCPYCRRPFSEMPHGLADLTLDIVDPNQPPYYRTNVRWVCATCNSEKQRTPPGLWAEKLHAWDLWREQQERLGHDPFAGLPLLEGHFEDGTQLRMPI